MNNIIDSPFQIEKFKDIFDDFPIPVHIWQQKNNDFVFSYFNQANNALADGKLKNFIGVKASELHKNEPELIKNLHQCANDNTDFTKEIKYKYKSTGKVRWLSVNYSYISPDLVLAITRDITEEKNKTEIIKHKLELQEAISKISSRFLSLEDIDNAINSTLKDIAQLSGADRSYVFLINDDKKSISNTHEWGKEGVKSHLNNFQDISIDLISWFLDLIKKDEFIHIPDLSSIPTRLKKVREVLQERNIKSLLNYPIIIEQEIVGFLGLDNIQEIAIWDNKDFILLQTSSNIIANALERERKEHNLKKLNISLDKRIKERTDRLLKSEKKYRKAYERVDFFKNLIAHDMNNILQNIHSSIQLTSIYSENLHNMEELTELHNIIEDQVKRGTKLIDNARKLSSIKEDQQTLRRIDLLKELKECIDLIQKTHRTREIQISLETDEDQYYILGNNLISDLFENILDNAIKYNDSSTIKISIIIEKVEKKKERYVKMKIIDNGIGIPNQLKAKLFQSIPKLSHSRKGMGFGLSLVKKIIDQIDGYISVKNRVKGDFTKGTKFIILIPEYRE